MKTRARWLDWAMLGLGIWLMLSPFILDHFDRWHPIVVGVGMSIFAILAIVRPVLWGEWFNLALGAWLIIGSFVLAHSSDVARWNHFIVGVLVVIDAVLVAYLRPLQRRRVGSVRTMR